MGRTITTTCDRCQKDTTIVAYGLRVIPPNGSVDNFDLCPACYRIFCDFMSKITRER